MTVWRTDGLQESLAVCSAKSDPYSSPKIFAKKKNTQKEGNMTNYYI